MTAGRFYRDQKLSGACSHLPIFLSLLHSGLPGAYLFLYEIFYLVTLQIQRDGQLSVQIILCQFKVAAVCRSLIRFLRRR